MKEWFKNFLSAIAGAVIVGTAVWFLKPCNEKLVIELPKRVIRDTMTIHDTTTVIKWKTHITIADTLTAVHRVVGGEKMDSMSVHLSSSSRPEYGLDSVTADYLYPPGWRQFVFWPSDTVAEREPVIPNAPVSSPAHVRRALGAGLETGVRAPMRTQATFARAYLKFSIKGGEALVAYKVGWGTGVEVSWRKEVGFF